MRKIPTLFERDWDGDRSKVVNTPNPECGWVLAGEGVATRKMDGMCCCIQDGKLLKRREVKKGKPVPAGLIDYTTDPKTGKTIGWMPVGDGPEDRYFREAFTSQLPDGTYELVGPKSQGNPERFDAHTLVLHGAERFEDDPPRTFDGLKAWLFELDIEGVVFHHSDGRMAKIKLRDFGWKRPSQ